MNDKPKKRRSAISIFTWGIVVLVLYVLSSGPAFWIHYTFFGQETSALAIIFIYSPLFWLAEESELFQSVFIWYVDLWTP